jgi:hypothetical protein
MGIVVVLGCHGAAASEAGNPKRLGSASLPSILSFSAKTKKSSVGIRPRAFQLETAFGDVAPASSAAAERPPTASTTSSIVPSVTITPSDNSRSVSMSSPHDLSLSNRANVSAISAAMYSKKAAAKRIIQTQDALELTNAAISEKLGIASNRWSQYRTGERTMPHNVLVGLKEQFGITTDWILAGDPSGLPQRIYARLRIAA